MRCRGVVRVSVRGERRLLTDSGGSPEVAWGSADQLHAPVTGGLSGLSVAGSDLNMMMLDFFYKHRFPCDEQQQTANDV